MTTYVSVLAAAFALTSLAAVSNAESAVVVHHRTHAHHKHAHHGHVARHRHRGVALHKVYSRRGPPQGYRFGFATYRGDPFYADDYYDGDRCYYLHKRDFCLKFRKPLNPH